MSQNRRSNVVAKRQTQASVFAALGDQTRLGLIEKLAAGEPYSISGLTRGSKLSRQAITKHLRVLESVGMVRSVRDGRENMFAFNPRSIVGIKQYLDLVSEQWDQALSRLKSFVEK
jgi:DNA-binding transcriptional ArsR family regulator